MIFTNLEDKLQNNSLSKKIITCIEFARNNNILDFANGSYFIPETDIKMNVMSYNTKSEEDGFWESHIKYIDVQVMLSGNEYISINNIYELESEGYKESDDFVRIKGTNLLEYSLEKMMF